MGICCHGDALGCRHAAVLAAGALGSAWTGARQGGGGDVLGSAAPETDLAAVVVAAKGIRPGSGLGRCRVRWMRHGRGLDCQGR